MRAVLWGSYWLWKYHQSNPEVGMGPSVASVINEFIAKAGINVSPANRAKIEKRLWTMTHYPDGREK